MFDIHIHRLKIVHNNITICDSTSFSGDNVAAACTRAIKQALTKGRSLAAIVFFKDNEKRTCNIEIISNYSCPVGSIAVIPATVCWMNVVNPQAVLSFTGTDHGELYQDVVVAPDGSIDIDTIEVRICSKCRVHGPLHFRRLCCFTAQY